jgi:hypothetical protein
MLVVRQKGKIEDNQHKERSTDKVQSTREYKKIPAWALEVFVFFVFSVARGLCDGSITCPVES